MTSKVDISREAVEEMRVLLMKTNAGLELFRSDKSPGVLLRALRDRVDALEKEVAGLEREIAYDKARPGWEIA